MQGFGGVEFFAEWGGGGRGVFWYGGRVVERCFWEQGSGRQGWDCLLFKKKLEQRKNIRKHLVIELILKPSS